MNQSDRAWAGLSDEERAALRRGEPLPRARRVGPVVRDVAAEEQAVFEEIRRADGPLRVDRIKSGRRHGVTDRALAALLRRGLVRRLALTDWAHSTRVEEVRVDAVEIVAEFAGAVLVHPLRGLPGERRGAA